MNNPTVSSNKTDGNINIRTINNAVSVSEIPLKYQSIFQSFPYFNIVQSTVFEDVFYSDKPLVICAPTGSGKTVIFELAIVRLLMLISDLNQISSKYKVIYMAPIKSLCNERYEDWKEKFTPLGALCIQLTGDSVTEDYFELQKYSIILTTPEKWDCVTRVWKNNKNLVRTVKLLLIDEIHLLNEEERGATMEAALSRMKTIQALLMGENYGKEINEPNLRFVAVSATFPNVKDVCEWLSFKNSKGASYVFNEDLRPVFLRKVVLGYNCSETFSEFRFDLMLSYKLSHVIQTYSEGKPTLVFCATRKSVVQTACILSKSRNFVMNSMHKQKLIEIANSVHDNKLRECILKGIGFHHAGLSVSDRRLTEEMFLTCQIQVLISTSTLAMGVNFPAHLVVIKSTNQYAGGCYKEYTDIQLLQMIGRAGRPQFDSTATAVIMTKSSLKEKYESIISGKQLIESSLHKHIVEHLNAEIVLGTITDVSIAMEWLRATYLYQRIFKNPKHYGMNMDLPKEKIERKLQDMCIIELNGLRKYRLICMDDDSFNVEPTDTGRLMAKYYLSFETVKKFSSLSGKENISELLALVSACKEFEDIQLRTNEKKLLNDLNRNKTTSIRFSLQGKIKTRAMKINCLIQSAFGCLSISEPAFNQDISKIFRNGVRISQCLSEYLEFDRKGFLVLYNSKTLAKCFKAKLWENSKHVSRQLDKIGVTLSNLLVNAGITSFEGIRRTNPRNLELVFMSMSERASISITVFLKNFKDLIQQKTTTNHGCHLMVGDADNNIIFNKKLKDYQLLQIGHWCKRIDFTKPHKGNEISIHLISENYVGLDVHKSFILEYDSSFDAQKELKENKNCPSLDVKNIQESKNKRACTHKCLYKDTCAHECCKTGVNITTKKSNMENFLDKLHNKMNVFPSKKIKIGRSSSEKHLVQQDSTQPILKNEQTASNITAGVSIHHKSQIEECSIPEAMWNDEESLYNIWADISGVDPTDGATAVEKEIHFPSKFSFDLNFQELSSQNEELCEQSNEVVRINQRVNNDILVSKSKSLEELISNKSGIYNSCKFPDHVTKDERKIWTIEKQNNSAAEEELFQMCLEYLCNY